MAMSSADNTAESSPTGLCPWHPLYRNKYATARVLIVDDNDFNRKIVLHTLHNSGFTQFTEAKDGQQALDIIQTAPPDIIILDLMMPIMDGYTFCRHLRQDIRFAHTPVLVLTGVSEPHLRSEALLCGASDLVSKPVVASELVSRISIHLERQWMLADLLDYQQTNERELQHARTMQHMLLPSEQQIQDYALQFNLAIASQFEPSTHIGGDFWGCTPLDEQSLALFMIDFSGHGVSAALNTFRFEVAMEQQHALAHDPAAYMAHLNGILRTQLQPGQFATMFYGVLDRTDYTLRYATAGTTASAILRPHSQTVDRLDGTGFPLAATQQAEYTTHTAHLNTGDILFLYSDALIEAPAPNGTRWEEEGLFTFLQDLVAVPDASLVTAENVMHAVRLEFDTVRASGGPVPDDLTLTAWQRISSPPSSA